MSNTTSTALSLPRSCATLPTPAGSTPIRLPSVTYVFHRGHLQPAHVDRRFGRCPPPLPALLARLLVGGQVKRDEEEQIGAQDGAAGNGSELLTGASSRVGHVGEVGRGEVGVRCEVDKSYEEYPLAPRLWLYVQVKEERPTEVNDELSNLQTGDPFFPPDADASRTLEVVPVHDNVDQQIESDGYPGDRRKSDELGEAEECSGTVMVGMQESCDSSVTVRNMLETGGKLTERLLLEDEKDGV